MTDLSVPWQPINNGSVLHPGSWFTEAVTAGAKPTLRDDPSWTYGTLEKTLEETPEALEPLWDCVLSLWRLRLSESKDLGDGTLLWVQMVVAWLVSG